MREDDISGELSHSESEHSEKLSEEEEEREVEKQGISDYERQRLSRIAENKARMEALGLHKMATSLMASSHNSIQPRRLTQSKGKTKIVDEDDDYAPNHDDDDDDDDDDFSCQSSSKSRRDKVKINVSKSKKRVPFREQFDGKKSVDDDDDQLMQAIKLSLQDSEKDATLEEKKENANSQQDAGKRKRKKSFSSRMQITEDELVLHFFQFDEEGRGFLTARDLERLAVAHDFTWSDRELADMIHCFDSDRDGKLNLDDFRKIAGRCNMIRAEES